ncbi:MAG: helicase-related protein, partial [Nanoarchaeota archaeon]
AFFDKFQSVIVDETHGAKSSSIKSCLQKCTNAEYRIGLTGTMPESKADKFTIYGFLGPKLYGIESSELIKRNILSKITIANILLEYSEEDKFKYWHSDDGKISKISYKEELELIYKNKDRNNVFKYIINNIDKKENILILCHKIDHLKDVESYLKENFKGYNIHTIYGKTEADEREAIRKTTNLTESNIIIGTYSTMSTGINIKRLHHVIFASSYKSKIKILQSIGRGLRKHDSKDKLILWDIVDDLTWTSNRGKKYKNFVYIHWRQRLQYYESQSFKFLNKKFNFIKYC